MGQSFKQPRDRAVILPPKDKVSRHVQAYCKPDWTKSLLGYLPTVLTLLAGVLLSSPAVGDAFVKATPEGMRPLAKLFFKGGLSVLAWPLLALVRVRLFVLFHDMGHYAYFPSRAVNHAVGTLTGVLVWAPFCSWRDAHNEHHRNVNNMSKRLYGQTAPWTTDEFKSAPLIQRLAYTLFYGKYTFFPINAYVVFVWVQRSFGTLVENSLQLAYVLSIYKFLGPRSLLFDQSTVWVMAMCGALFSHVEHTFDGAYRRDESEWDMYESSMLGSSCLVIPWWLKWMTNGLEYHHIHHMNTRVPCYNLADCHEQGLKYFRVVPLVDFTEFVKTLDYNLWDGKVSEFKDVYELFSL